MGARPVMARRIAAAVIAIAALAATSACAAGQHAQTAEESPTVDGTAGIIGALHLNEVAIKAPTDAASYPAGAAVQVLAAIVNTGTSTDQLVGVSATGAGGSALYASVADAAAVLSPSAASSSAAPSAPSSSASSSASSGSASASTSASATATSGTASGSPTASESATGSASASAGATLNSLDLPPGELTGLGLSDTDKVLVLTGLSAALFPGTTVAVTFRFAMAGSITLQVPVQLTTGASTTMIVPPLATESTAA